MTLIEIIAVFFGLLSIYFSVKENILVFPTGLINTNLYIYLCMSVGLYGEGILNMYYTGMSIWGWYNWSRKESEQKNLPISTLSLYGWIWTTIYFILLFIVIYFFLVYYSKSTVPLADGLATSIAFVAMYLMAKKKIEHWIWWILTDTISIPLFIYKGLPITSLQFGTFVILAITGYFAWRKKIRILNNEQKK